MWEKKRNNNAWTSKAHTRQNVHLMNVMKTDEKHTKTKHERLNTSGGGVSTGDMSAVGGICEDKMS